MRHLVLEERARRMARKMVYLELQSKQALLAGQHDAAVYYWRARQEIVAGRMLILRQLWASERETRARVKSDALASSLRSWDQHRPDGRPHHRPSHAAYHQTICRVT